jgi:hypothetical protein
MGRQKPSRARTSRVAARDDQLHALLVAGRAGEGLLRDVDAGPALHQPHVDGLDAAAGGAQVQGDRGAGADELGHRLELHAHRGHALPPREIAEAPEHRHDGDEEDDQPDPDARPCHPVMVAAGEIPT